MRLRYSHFLSLALLSSTLLIGCGKEGAPVKPLHYDGARSAVFSTDTLAIEGAKNQIIRTSSTLGVYVTEYLTNAPVESAVQGAIDAIAIQSMITSAAASVQDPDFELLQVFQDALQVDVFDLLNRSENRSVALDTYTEALTNVATHAHDRYKELTASQTELKDRLRTLSKEKNDADRAVKKALKDKDYEAASEAQKLLSEKNIAYSDADLQNRQIEDIVSNLDQLLNLYGQKILAIQQNREIIISGLTVVDVPGIDELKIILRTKSKKSGSTFEGLF